MIEEYEVRKAFSQIGGRKYKNFIGALDWNYLLNDTNPGIRSMMQALIARYHKYNQDVQSTDVVLDELAKPNSKYVNNKHRNIILTNQSAPKNIMWILNKDHRDGTYLVGKPVNTQKVIRVVHKMIDEKYQVTNNIELTDKRLRYLHGYIDTIEDYESYFNQKLKKNKYSDVCHYRSGVDDLLYQKYDYYVDKITFQYDDEDFNDFLANIWSRYDTRDQINHEPDCFPFHRALCNYLNALELISKANRPTN